MFFIYLLFCSVLTEGWTCADLHHCQQGLSQMDQISRSQIFESHDALLNGITQPHSFPFKLKPVSFLRRQIFGDNIIDVPVKPYLQLLLEEVPCFALVLLYSYSDVQKSSLCREIQLKDQLCLICKSSGII